MTDETGVLVALRPAPARADRIESDYSWSGRVTADMDGLTEALAVYGLDRHHVHTETFGARAGITPGIAASATPPHQPAGPPGPAGDGPHRPVARSGISALWRPSYGSLLEFAEALEPPASGNCLPCIAKPSEPIALDL